VENCQRHFPLVFTSSFLKNMVLKARASRLFQKVNQP